MIEEVQTTITKKETTAFSHESVPGETVNKCRLSSRNLNRKKRILEKTILVDQGLIPHPLLLFTVVYMLYKCSFFYSENTDALRNSRRLVRSLCL
ncbi:hypothetical protein OSTOST_25577 [Ostertagia ostertagi]